MFRLIKIIFLFLFVIAALYFGASVFIPAKYTIERTETLNAPVDIVFEQVSHFKNNQYKINYFSLFKTLQHKKIIKEKTKNHFIYNKNNGFLSLTNNLINNMDIYKKIFYKYIKKN